MPRSEWNDDTVRALGVLAARDPLENVFTTLVRHPDLFRRYNVFGAHILLKSTLDPRDRELVILRTGWRRDCEYEFAQHTLVARSIGMLDDEIARVLDGPDAGGWTPHEAAILSAVDELVDANTISDATWSVLAGTYTEQQMMDLVFTIGAYSLVCWAVNAFGVSLDVHLTGHPWRTGSGTAPDGAT